MYLVTQLFLLFSSPHPSPEPISFVYVFVRSLFVLVNPPVTRTTMTFNSINQSIIAELSKERPSDKDYKVYLKDIFKICRDTIGKISEDSIANDLPSDFDFEVFKKELTNSTTALLKAYNCYSEGKLIKAINFMKKFLDADVIKTFNLIPSQCWFRARKTNKNASGFKAKEMFHIPFEKRTEVVNYRFSITGYPCLYIGNSILSCWEEMHTPALDDFVVSRVQVNEGKELKTLDLRIPCQTEIDSLWSDIDDTERRKANLMLLKTWPLIIACSIKTITPNAQFKYEYIHPQLLMLALKEQDTDIYGITYTSTHIDKNMSVDVGKYTNVAIPVKQVNSKGLCKYLCNTFSITRGVPFMEADIKNVFDMSHKFSIGTNGHMYISTYRDGSATYENTKFGQLEDFLKASSVTLEQLS